MVKFVKNHSLYIFFALAYILPWLIWGTSLAQQNHMISWHLPQSLAFWIGLTAATYMTAAISGGKEAVLDLLKRLIRYKVKIVWYVVVLLITPLLALVSILLFQISGLTNNHFATDIAVSNIFIVFLIEMWLFLITEETAWRGFALPRLQKKYPPLQASLVLGLLWGFWHIPLFLMAESFQSNLPFAGFILSAVATSVLASWIFNNTKGSVLLASLFHASTDVAILYTGVMSDSKMLFWLFVVTQVIAAVIVTRTKAFANTVKSDPYLTY